MNCSCTMCKSCVDNLKIINDKIENLTIQRNKALDVAENAVLKMGEMQRETAEQCAYIARECREEFRRESGAYRLKEGAADYVSEKIIKHFNLRDN